MKPWAKYLISLSFPIGETKQLNPVFSRSRLSLQILVILLVKAIQYNKE